MTATPAAVIVLSAGDGTRMKSRLNKALHRIGGRTLVGHAVAAAAGTGASYVTVVVRAQKDDVAAAARAVVEKVLIAEQDDVYGTGRAAECGLQTLPPDLTGTVLVTTGDTPLLDARTLLQLTAEHEASAAAVTVITGVLDDATGYGRVVRDDHGNVRAIVEHKQATEEQRQINEFNSGLFAFDAAVLRQALAEVGVNSAAGEKYLTDVVEVAVGHGLLVRAHVLDDLWQTEGVNDKAQLARLGAELNRRTLDKLMREQGAVIEDPASTWVDVEVTVGADTIVHPGCQLYGATSIGAGCEIGPDTTLKDTEVRDGASVIRTHADLALIGQDATVGPFSYLRPGTTLGAGGKIGGFVETKNAQIGDDAKVPHLTYCGDAVIGAGTNIGAGTIFANYDGVNKHQTRVGENSFVGSNSVIVAPRTIGDGVYVAAGSAVVEDVEPGQLGVTRAHQRNVDGWVFRRRADTATATSAKQAIDRAAHEESTETEEPQGN
ncbi:bifunctional UDP-N-acetylglucosamine diphosphorylase/glucosamine-1-phosphate N-acetyltransferase GlmU [Rudaeicoccus suwonensis]|uniref:Bifunctional protein GlmU n=1 Tax=Rudaeicoccus suwonensis TaxID=657409 RepID=A0A561E867_9MICO|nr:bifunctional UDP-N-acetylglucosamine diphosphorylase/glucosamine-1-phosphate N-acetyltransferase GlmU [Rudaeicoccus suwonensis]TWE11811.1 UDP-N-acetylglucosamine pyrophosphorylase /glucosamine-1-phosphate N-acetyltransferase [Rudaeicoccus suwonensis]